MLTLTIEFFMIGLFSVTKEFKLFNTQKDDFLYYAVPLYMQSLDFS